MKSPDLLTAAADCQLTNYLAGRGSRLHLVAPPDVLDSFRQRVSSYELGLQTRLEDVPASAQRALVYAPEHEMDAVRAARAARPDLQVLGITHHIIPALAVHPKLNFERLARASFPSPEHRFAVICTPRTGSTFLCELLAAAGMAAPKEHLRAPLIWALRRPGADRGEIRRVVEGIATQDGIFGTKLISHFLFDLQGAAGAPQRLQRMAEQGFRFIHLQRDLVDQAVSKFLAAKSDVWHARGEVSDVARQKRSRVAYDAEAVRRAHDRAQAEDAHLRAALAAVPESLVLRVDYDEVVAQPLEHVVRCAAHVGCAADPGRVDMGRLPVRLAQPDDPAHEIRRAFLADLGAGGRAI